MVDHNKVYEEKYAASQRAAARMITRLGVATEKLDKFVTEGPDDDRLITGYNIKVRYDTIGDVLLVVKCRAAQGEMVGFHAADTPSDVLLGFVNRVENGLFKWREERPYEPGNGNK